VEVLIMKRAIITGGTSGVGAAIATGLVCQGYNVIIVGSSEIKGNAVAEKLNSLRRNSAEFFKVNLSDLEETSGFADKILREGITIDVLANIAGYIPTELEVNGEGYEKSFTVGYLSSFLLSYKLAPAMEKSIDPRIVLVSGDGSVSAEELIDFDNVDCKSDFGIIRSVKNTIHIKSVLTQFCAEDMKSRGISVNSFSPGLVKSDLLKKQPLFLRMIRSILTPMFSDGCEAGVYVCTSSELEKVTGKMITKKKKAITILYSEKYTEKLKELTLDKLSLYMSVV
jgi:NAD(P)-dependent dehydrogenase (short-subunit alcohol dehydrogenase family)